MTCQLLAGTGLLSAWSESTVDLQPNLEPSTARAEHLLGSWLGERPTCTAVVPPKGGLVNSVFRLEFDRPPSRAVVKIHGIDGNTFAEEADSLRYLAAETSYPVPHVHAHDGSGRVVPHAFLLLEHLGVCVCGAPRWIQISENRSTSSWQAC